MVGLIKDFKLNYEELENNLSRRTKVVAVTMMSNVLGTINDVKRIAKLAHEVDAVVVADGAQAVPHMPVNVKNLDIDFLAFSGHKMLGPTGIGVLYGKRELLESLTPHMLGGGIVKSMVFKNGVLSIEFSKSPWKFEAGTPNIAGAVGLAEAIKYLSRLGMENVRAFEEQLTKYIIDKINDELEGYVEVYGTKDVRFRRGIVSFNVKGIHPHVIATMLDRYNIAVRSGYHCAQPLHQYLGITQGSVRASLYVYNTREEVDYFIEFLRRTIKELKFNNAHN